MTNKNRIEASVRRNKAAAERHFQPVVAPIIRSNENREKDGVREEEKNHSLSVELERINFWANNGSGRGGSNTPSPCRAFRSCVMRKHQ